MEAVCRVSSHTTATARARRRWRWTSSAAAQHHRCLSLLASGEVNKEGSDGGGDGWGVQLSDFLLKRCNWKEAPKCSDYVGSVIVKLTPDSRGRGLFATQDLQPGTLLLVSNALAVTHDDPQRIRLSAKLLELARGSPSFLGKLCTLASTSATDQLQVPPMDFLTCKGLPEACYSKKIDTVDIKWIRDLIMVNAFEGELTSWPKVTPAITFSGLWLIPSFINHSCIRNASRLIVGEAMFVLAASEIKAGEEITISYIDALAPCKQRQEVCQDMQFGFVCRCKRCALERSLAPSLNDVSERFHLLYNKVAEEVLLAVFSRECLPLSSFPACVELSESFSVLKERLDMSTSISKLERQWILAGYASAFLGKWLVMGYATAFAEPSKFVTSSALDLVEAMKSTVPGTLRTLSFTTLMVLLARKTDRNGELACQLFKLGMDECLRVYGQQNLDILVKLMEQSLEVVPFF